MSWASHFIDKLSHGETVSFRPRGNSMSGKIDSGQLVTVEPVRDRKIEVGTIVLCKVNGAQYLHIVKAISGDRFQIGNNRGRVNGWTTRRNIFGIVTRIESWVVS
jgi:Peptidase S24-like